MTGAEHYAEAEAILERAMKFSRSLGAGEITGYTPEEHAQLAASCAQLAQAHATLALTQATLATTEYADWDKP